jgi:hypothetical protein
VPNYRFPARLSEARGKSFLLRYWRSNRERARVSHPDVGKQRMFNADEVSSVVDLAKLKEL